MNFAIALPQGPELVVILVILVILLILWLSVVFVRVVVLPFVRRLGNDTPAAPPPPTEPSSDRISQLERLAKLRQDDALTEEEFQREKARLD